MIIHVKMPADATVRDARPMTRSRAEVLALYELYTEEGMSLAELGAREGVSRENIRQLFKRFELPRRTQADVGAADSAQTAQQARERAEEIKSLYMRHGTIQAVQDAVGLPRRAVAAIIAEIPNRESYRRRGEQWSYGREELVEHIQRAATAKGEPLTIPAYRQAAKELGLAGFDTLIRFFILEDPENPWLAALDAAGVSGNAPRRKRPQFDFDACVNAVAACIEDNNGERVSYPHYRAWRADHPDRPSGPTIRKNVSWSIAVELALERLAEHAQ